MKRRDFIQISSLSLATLLLDGCEVSQEYDVVFLNDMAVGHLAFESREFPISKKLRTDYLIVGGGIAGLSAAYQIRDKNFLLCELSDLLGGSSAASYYKNVPICHGAHYDLAYPSNFGEEALKMLSALGIVKFDQFSNLWQFTDKQYLIPKSRESQTYAFGQLRKDVLVDGATKLEFIKLIESFSGSMPMPTRLIDKKYRYLNDITFKSWLEEKITLTQEFTEGLDYHMKDDYGAGSDAVSALAGIHYFVCRPYYTKAVQLFSPPQGNAYFTHKIYDQLPSQFVLKSHLVKRIKEKQGGFEVEIVDAIKREILELNCDKIIYAGHKHSLKYIYPNDFHLFQKTQYAPWVVVNLILNKSINSEAFWQNEMLTSDKSLMGFVDSNSQFSDGHNQQVLTVYFCFEPEEREMMSLIEQRKHVFINQVIAQVEKYFDHSFKKNVDRVVIKQMGHAMPIPAKGYLFNEANDLRSNASLVYAGVDNGRLPLLFEAIDSGISAIDALAQ